MKVTSKKLISSGLFKEKAIVKFTKDDEARQLAYKIRFGLGLIYLVKFKRSILG